MTTSLPLPSQYPPPGTRIVTIPLSILPAYLDLHNRQAHEFKYVERYFDYILFVKPKEEGGENEHVMGS